MKRFAEVNSIPEAGIAEVKIRRHSSCGNCGKCKGGAEVDIVVADPLGVEPGEIVALEMSGENLLNAALLIYFVPIIGLIAGYLISAQLGIDSEGVRVLGGVILFVLAMLAARRFGQKNEKDYELKIIEKL